jgi:predicted ATPase
MLARIQDEGGLSYRDFSDPAELQQLVENDLALLLSERFELTRPGAGAAAEAQLAGALPVPITPLLGREREVAAVEDLVVKEGVRLVTVTGPGGVGKTRLAVEAAQRLDPDFADGVRFVELAAVSAVGLVAGAIAAGLGLNTSASRLVTDLESYLRDRRLLLVLDNFEQVMGAAPLLTELLAAAPGLVVLVTSRMVLRLRGEHELPVPPMPVPAGDAVPDPADLQRYASVSLFAERAHAAAPGFELTASNAAAVAEICRRLDGVPLAIELAAARVRLLPPQALLSRLDQRFSLLTGGARDLPERQRTLRNTLDWSFGLLSAGEQVLFARLGVFPGTFGLPAVEAVCGQPAAGAGPLVDTLSSLVDSSLVRTQTRDGEPRFSLLETIREYALDRLRDSGEWTAVHDQHAAYFAALAEPTEADLAGPGQLAWLNRLEAERDNVRSAMSWLVDQDRLRPALHLAWSTWRFWWLRGHAEEIGHYMELILAKSEHQPPHEAALALAAGGFTFLAGGDQARALPLFERSLPLYRQAGDELGQALAAATLGHVLSAQNEDQRARELLTQTLAELRKTGSGQQAGPQRVPFLLNVTLACNFLGQIELKQGNLDRAAQLFTDALTAARSAADRFTILVSLYDLALSGQARGDLAGAAAHLQEGLALAAEAGDETSAAYYLEVLASVAGQQDNPQRAVRLLTAARSILETRGSGWLHAYVPRAADDDATLPALRARIGDTAFEEAKAWASSTGNRQAVEYALK